ncbi:ubiquitin-protein ligase E3 [Schizosaccharomyces japonicus yFS275]|uniref:Ubiquitin-protein ligase E3 n=1 Tax=Schizosaccharomyces japonicus (strain yFS275 / FY16936) TaxID=402676 RepID=B6JZ31_SCHJY|nr:ubiquitin-protein ligase E3 [Schizosaccharomyces japonicus yFS275]EEB06799.1 ubiquitin-protein ligase E3 [Schizosaccharomyces japonicus yFS275]
MDRLFAVTQANEDVLAVRTLVDSFRRWMKDASPLLQQLLEIGLLYGLLRKRVETKTSVGWLIVLSLLRLCSQRARSLRIRRSGEIVQSLYGLGKLFLSYTGILPYTNALASFSITGTQFPDASMYQELANGNILQTYAMSTLQQIVDTILATGVPSLMVDRYRQGQLRVQDTKIENKAGQCAFCILRSSPKTQIVHPYRASCGHLFCYACITSKLSRTSSVPCPLCPKDITSCRPALAG